MALDDSFVDATPGLSLVDIFSFSLLKEYALNSKHTTNVFGSRLNHEALSQPMIVGLTRGKRRHISKQLPVDLKNIVFEPNGDLTHMIVDPCLAWEWYCSGLKDGSRIAEEQLAFCLCRFLFHQAHLAMRGSGDLILEDEYMPATERMWYLDNNNTKDVIREKRGQYVVISLTPYDNCDVDAIPLMLAYRIDGSLQTPQRGDGLRVVGDLTYLLDAASDPEEYAQIVEELLRCDCVELLGECLSRAGLNLPQSHRHYKWNNVPLLPKKGKNTNNDAVKYEGESIVWHRDCVLPSGENAGFTHLHSGYLAAGSSSPDGLQFHVVISETHQIVYGSTDAPSEGDSSFLLEQACAKASKMTDAELDVDLVARKDLPDEWTEQSSFHAGELIGTPLMLGSAVFRFVECETVRDILERMRICPEFMCRPVSEKLTADALIDCARHIRVLLPRLGYALSVWSVARDEDGSHSSSRVDLLCALLRFANIDAPSWKCPRHKASMAILFDFIRDVS